MLLNPRQKKVLCRSSFPVLSNSALTQTVHLSAKFWYPSAVKWMPSHSITFRNTFTHAAVFAVGVHVVVQQLSMTLKFLTPIPTNYLIKTP